MRKTIIAFLAGVVLTGCASSPLDLAASALGANKGPEITAQAGATNTRQAVGLTGNVDTSSEVKNEIKGAVDNLDTSTGKRLSASSISASTITAERIEIRNNDGEWKTVAVIVSALFLLALIAGLLAYRQKRKAQ